MKSRDSFTSILKHTTQLLITKPDNIEWRLVRSFFGGCKDHSFSFFALWEHFTLCLSVYFLTCCLTVHVYQLSFHSVQAHNWQIFHSPFNNFLSKLNVS